jgi:hypothetical protein
MPYQSIKLLFLIPYFLLCSMSFAQQGEQAQKDLPRIKNEQLADALRLFDPTFQENPDIPNYAWLSFDFMQTADSIIDSGMDGYQMDTTIFQTARYLSAYHPKANIMGGYRLLIGHKYNEASFMIFLGMMRSHLADVQEGHARSLDDYTSDITSQEQMNVYLGANVNNWIRILKTTKEFYRTTEQPNYGGKADQEAFKQPIKAVDEAIKMLLNNPGSNTTERWRNSRAERDYRRKALSKTIATSQKFQKSGALIGSWTGRSMFERDQLIHIRFDKEGNVFGMDLDFGANEQTRYQASYDQVPMPIQFTVISSDNTEPYLVDQIVTFLSETEIQIGYPSEDDWDGFFASGNSTIYTRDVPGQKNFQTVKWVNTIAPKPKDMVPMKEVKRFWEDNIRAIVDVNIPKVVHQSKFPLLGDQNREMVFYGGEQTQEDSLYALSTQFPQELRNGLRDMNYEHVSQIQLENGQVALMIHFTGLNYFKADYYESGSDAKFFGLIFEKEGKEWVLTCSSKFGDFGSTDAFIEEFLMNVTKRTILETVIKNLMSLDKSFIVAQTHFPLMGNWGSSIGLPGDFTSWTSENFADKMDAFFNEGFQAFMSEYTVELQQDYSQSDAHIFEAYASYESQEVNGDWINRVLRMKFGKTGPDWKLISLMVEDY